MLKMIPVDISNHGSWNGHTVNGHISLFIAKGITKVSGVTYQYTEYSATLAQCAQICDDESDCKFIDYNSQAGDSLIYYVFNEFFNDPVIVQTGHISKVWSSK